MFTTNVFREAVDSGDLSEILAYLMRSSDVITTLILCVSRHFL